MKLITISNQKIFDLLMRGVNDGSVKFKQKDQVIIFRAGDGIFEIDFPAYYHFFKEKKHGEDRVAWG